MPRGAALVDADGRITGIVDFGDMSYSAMVVDIASVVDSLASGRAGDELFRVSRLVLDGYQRIAHPDVDPEPIFGHSPYPTVRATN